MAKSVHITVREVPSGGYERTEMRDNGRGYMAPTTQYFMDRPAEMESKDMRVLKSGKPDAPERAQSALDRAMQHLSKV